MYQLVDVIQDGKKAKLSKRKGISVLLRDIISEIGTDLIRYFLISRNANSPISFDLLNIRQKNKDNPFFYIQYAIVRCRSLLMHAKELATNFHFEEVNDFSEFNHNEKVIISHLDYFPCLLEKVILFL